MTISGAEWWGLEARARAWPEWLTLRDPWSGDEAILWPSEFSTVVPGGPLDAHQHDRADALFVRVYRAWLDGDCDWGSVHEAARARGVCQPIRHDRRLLRVASEPVSDQALSDIAEDWIPDLGVVAMDRVLGPWSECQLSKAARTCAGAVFSLVPAVAPGVTPVDRFSSVKPRPPPRVRQALRAIAMAPPMLWRIRDRCLEPALPLAPSCVPSEPVVLEAHLLDAPALLGRAYRVGQQWHLAMGLALPDHPSARVLERRMLIELYRLRRHSWRLTWEDLLRLRGEVLYRTSCEWLWMQHGNQARDGNPSWMEPV